MTDSVSIGRKRRSLWRQIISDAIEPASAEERAFVARAFDGMSLETHKANLSRGFPPKHGPSLRALCEKNGVPYDRSIWLEKAFDRRSLKAEAMIDWEFDRIDNVNEFYDQLKPLYLNAHTYESLRVGGAYSSNRTQFHIEDDLAVKPKGKSIRIPYLEIFWKRVRSGEMSGHSVHLVRNLDRLLELWATVRILKDEPNGHQNKITLVSSLSEGAEYEPTMGARIVDDRIVLFSMPATGETTSTYSSWIRSERLAVFAQSYIRRAASTGRILSGLDDLAEEKIFRDAFERLATSAQAKTTNYGYIESFKEAVEIRKRMIEWVKEGDWLPVIS